MHDKDDRRRDRASYQPSEAFSTALTRYTRRCKETPTWRKQHQVEARRGATVRLILQERCNKTEQNLDNHCTTYTHTLLNHPLQRFELLAPSDFSRPKSRLSAYTVDALNPSRSKP